MNKIFVYLDYRLYLKEYFSSMKEKYSYFSYRWFAQKANISSSGLYQRVVKGERNLTTKTVEQFIAGVGFDKKEAEYFRLLVGFNQAKTTAEKQRNYIQLLSISDFVEEHRLALDEYSYLSQWYFPVIRELVTHISTENGYDLLAKTVSPPITSRQAQKAVELLCRMEFIEKDESGFYSQRDTSITTGNDLEKMRGLACRTFNKEMLELAKKSLDSHAVNERFAAGITMGISDSCYDHIIQEYDAFRERIVSIVEKDTSSSRVCQMSFQLFPLSQDISPESEIEK